MINNTKALLGQTDIYLIDQIMKGRYSFGDKILDAGCGEGRNLHWFLANDLDMSGIDIDENAIHKIRKDHDKLPTQKFFVSSLEMTPFDDSHFDHIICNAVLHFAKDHVQFEKMIAEMVRILKPGGSLFVRMASDIGIETHVKPIAGGVFLIPDGSKRFLLNRAILVNTMQTNKLSFLEPLKTVNVDDVRCMSTLVLQKN